MKATLAIIALVLASCSGTDMETSQGQLNEPLRMAYQQQATIVTIVASKPGAPTESLVLTMGDTTGPSGTVTYLDYTVTVQELIPYPQQGPPPNPGDYVATLIVLKP